MGCIKARISLHLLAIHGFLFRLVLEQFLCNRAWEQAVDNVTGLSGLSKHKSLSALDVAIEKEEDDKSQELQ